MMKTATRRLLAVRLSVTCLPAGDATTVHRKPLHIHVLGFLCSAQGRSKASSSTQGGLGRDEGAQQRLGSPGHPEGARRDAYTITEAGLGHQTAQN